MKKEGPYGLYGMNQDFRRDLEREEAVHCPHCGQRAAHIKHTANRDLVLFLKLLGRFALAHDRDGFYRTADFVEHPTRALQRRCSSGTASGRYMKLIECSDEHNETNAGGAPVGTYRMRKAGWDFLMGRASVPEHIFEYLTKEISRSKKQVMVSTAAGKPFNFATDVAGIRAPTQSGKGIPLQEN